jgi:acyl-CoA synthetase (NDP forming)
MLADLAAEAGVELPPLSSAAIERLGSTWPGFRPANPLDPWGVADYGEVYATAIDTAAAEDVDLVLVAQDQQTTSGAYEHQLGLDLAHYLAEACKRHDRTAVFLSPSSHDPPVALSEQCRQHEVALLRGGRPGLQAIARLASRRWSLVTETGTPLQVSDIPELQDIDGVVDEDEALGVLDRFGVETPRRLGATTHEDCLRIATDIGYPVVLKGTGGAVAHKTELGLVHHGILSEGSLLAALDMVDTAAGRLGLDIGYMVAEQVSGDLELLVGFHRDNTFGPTVVVGLGGVWAEALNVVAVRIGEIGPEQALDIIDESGVGRLLRSSRSGPLAVAAVVDVVTAVSEIGRNHPAISAIDVNPVIVSRDRAVAVDALMTIEREPQNAEGERNDSE